MVWGQATIMNKTIKYAKSIIHPNRPNRTTEIRNV